MRFDFFCQIRNYAWFLIISFTTQDDTQAIIKAMGNTTRCARGCNGSSTKNAIVYFPPGNYLISSTIALPYGTQVIGDANTRPTLIAAPSFVGLGVLSTDEYTGGQGGDEELVVSSILSSLKTACDVSNADLWGHHSDTTSTSPISTDRFATWSSTSARSAQERS
jgi:hypothetical protein